MNSTPRKRLAPSNATPIKLNRTSFFTLRKNVFLLIGLVLGYFAVQTLEKHKVGLSYGVIMRHAKLSPQNAVEMLYFQS